MLDEIIEPWKHISLAQIVDTMAVREGDDGKTYLSKMNMGLMARLFGGNIQRIVGGEVAKEESRILAGLVVE